MGSSRDYKRAALKLAPHTILYNVDSADDRYILAQSDSCTCVIMRAGTMKYDKKKFVHCAILGDGMVGKTCLTLSYTQKAFVENYTATVFENYAGN